MFLEKILEIETKSPGIEPITGQHDNKRSEGKVATAYLAKTVKNVADSRFPTYVSFVKM